jgi:hypothetical protein
MLNHLKKFFSPKNKVTVESIEEKAIRLSNAFAMLVKEKYDFDDVIIGIDNPDNINSDCMIYKSLVAREVLERMESEFDIKNAFLKHAGSSVNSRRLITFKLLREYDDLYEHQYMFAMTSLTSNNLFFLTEYNDDIFKHYEIEDFLSDFGRFKFFAYYSYNHTTNKFSRFIEIPLNYEGSKLLLREAGGQFFTPYRTYILTFEIDIDNQRFSKKTNVRITFKNNIIKSVDCDIANHADFEHQLLKILFPFNLSDEQRKELHLEDISLEQLSTSFDNEYEVHQMAKFNINNRDI